MKKLKLFLLCLSLSILMLSLVACDSNDDENSGESPQNMQTVVTPENEGQIPYNLTGQNENWKITIDVRKALDTEKSLMIQTLEKNIQLAEKNYENKVISKDSYKSLTKIYEESKTDLEKNNLYVTTINGQYISSNALNIPEGIINFKIQNSAGEIVLLSGVSTNLLDKTWYTSYNTTGGLLHSSSIFMPPAENSKFILSYNGSDFEIPLTLNK